MARPYFFAVSRVIVCVISRRTRLMLWGCPSWPVAFCMRSENCSLCRSSRWALSSVADLLRSSLSSISAHRPGHESGGDRKLGGGQAERLARRGFVDALDLVDHATGGDLRHPVLDVALAGAHSHFDRLLGDRLVREHADPHLAAALDVAADRAAGRLDLAGGQLAVRGGLEAELAEADGGAVPAQAVVTALEYLAVLGSLGLQHGGLPRFLGRTGRALGALFRLFLADLAEVKDLALVDPDLHADDSVRGQGLGEAVVDVGAQGVQGHAALAVPLRTRDLGAVEAAGDVHLDAQGTEAHRVADGALHRAAEHDAALELLRDRLGHQLRVELRLADLGDVDVHGHAHQVGHVLLELLDVLAALADHHARASRVDGDARRVRGTLDQDLGDARLRQTLAQHRPDLEVGGEVLPVLALVGEPLGIPVLGNAQADSGRVNFMAHRFSP